MKKSDKDIELLEIIKSAASNLSVNDRKTIDQMAEGLKNDLKCRNLEKREDGNYYCNIPKLIENFPHLAMLSSSELSFYCLGRHDTCNYFNGFMYTLQ